MRSWNHFPLWRERPEQVRFFSKRERPELEMTIAMQVSDLLRLFGSILTLEIDVQMCEAVEVTKTMTMLELEEIPLEDDGELVIDQLPWTSTGFCIERGAHSIAHTDEDGAWMMNLTVWDPKIEAPTRITDNDGKKVGRVILQELHEALIVINQDLRAHSTPNKMPYQPSEFPIPVVEPELVALAAELGF